MKNLELNSLGLEELDAMEMQFIEGDGTKFAYDVGTFCRWLYQGFSHDYVGQAGTLAVWSVLNK